MSNHRALKWRYSEGYNYCERHGYEFIYEEPIAGCFAYLQSMDQKQELTPDSVADVAALCLITTIENNMTPIAFGLQESNLMGTWKVMVLVRRRVGLKNP